MISLTIEFETNSFLLIALSCEVCTWSDQASGFLFRELAVGWVTERPHVPPFTQPLIAPQLQGQNLAAPQALKLQGRRPKGRESEREREVEGI